MKKSLLLIAGATMALTASAAVEVGFCDQTALFASFGEAHVPAGKDKGEAWTIPAGAVIAESENVKMTMMYEQADGSKQNPEFNHFKTVMVNGEAVTIVAGLGGSSNGKLTGLAEGPQADGCIYQIDVKKDGYIIVVSKISSNKNFYAYEGTIGNAPVPVAYTLGMDLDNSAYPDIEKIVYTLPTYAQDNEAAGQYVGQLDLASPEIEKYTFGNNEIAWPIRIATQNSAAATAGNGTGVMIFPVSADAGSYMVFATGSKMNTCGYIFVEGTEMPEVSLVREAGFDDKAEWKAKTVVVTGNPSSAIEDIIVDADAENAPMFNVLGQQVDASYKGLVIKNGKKFINR